MSQQVILQQKLLTGDGGEKAEHKDPDTQAGAEPVPQWQLQSQHAFENTHLGRSRTSSVV